MNEGYNAVASHICFVFEIITLHSENIARAKKNIEELFSEGLREIVAIDCAK